MVLMEDFTHFFKHEVIAGVKTIRYLDMAVDVVKRRVYAHMANQLFVQPPMETMA